MLAEGAIGFAAIAVGAGLTDQEVLNLALDGAT
jgi:hypothetical protein